MSQASDGHAQQSGRASRRPPALGRGRSLGRADREASEGALGPDEHEVPADAPTQAAQVVESVQSGEGAPGPTERIRRGLARAALAVPLGIAATVGIAWFSNLGLLVALALPFVAAPLYNSGAGCAPRKGVLPLIGLIAAGVILSFMSVIAVDAWKFAPTAEGRGLGYSSAGLVVAALTHPRGYRGYSWLAVLFAVCGALGTYIAIVRRLILR